ncbi:Regulator of G-protein signaling 7 [Papilio machaon]|uniref:Regulator of G-protein signaling 7 n=1 Tax=Papilio machaon TaxID=76193 RepID=A0A194QRP0_PAPMA|nr:Regulator of G-protein signaling 7 [Papilio machaon]
MRRNLSLDDCHSNRYQMTSVDEFVNSSAWLIKVSGGARGRERHAASPADAHGGRLAARAQPPRPRAPAPPAPAHNMDPNDASAPRHRPLAFDKMESLIKEMQDPETGVPVRSQKLFLSVIPSAFMGYDLVEWLMERFNLDEANNIEAINLANQLCQYGYFFPVNDSKNLVLKDDSSLYRFQSPYYWPWQGPRVGGGSSAPALGPDNVEYAIYLVKRTLRNKQRHGLEDYEQEALANLKKNLAAKWDFITMQAEEQVRLAKERKKGDKIVSDSQERAYWRVARPPPGVPSALEPCPVPVRVRQPRPKKRSIHQLTREIEHLKASLDRTRVKTSIVLEALVSYAETFAPYDPWITPPQPSNPWISDDTLFWQINSPLVEVPSEKRVQRWALSIEELVSDPTGLQEFTSFLRKEYSHENIRFWLAVMDLRRSSPKQIPKKLEEIYEEFLKPGAPCEINIDGATAERVAEGLRSGSRYALDHAADHVYDLLLKKDCYPRFIRSDHFQRLLTEGRNVHQKKAKFFNFGGQVKKKPGSAGSSGAGLSRRRGSDRSLSGSAHELAVCAAQPPRAPEPPPHSHSQSNLCDIPFRDPLDDDTADVLPWECTSREGVYGSTSRRRQDSAADSGSSSSDVSSAVAVAERTRRLPQQSTLDGGLRGAPPPLRRLSAVEPRHLAPLGSPPHSPRPPRPAPSVPPPAAPAPPHPTPTISVSSAPDDESADSPPGTGSPEERRSVAASEEPSSVFASADVTPTEPTVTNFKALDDRCALAIVKTISSSISSGDARTDVSNVDIKLVEEPSTGAQESELYDESGASGADSKVPEWTKSSEEDVVSVQRSLSREPSTTKEVSPASCKDISSGIGEVPESESVNAEAGDPSELDCPVHGIKKIHEGKENPSEAESYQVSTPESTEQSTRSAVSEPPSGTCRPAAVTAMAAVNTVGAVPAAQESARPPVAPLAVCEDIGVDEDTADRVPSELSQRAPSECKAASESDAIKKIAHKDELSSVSESNIVKRENIGGIGERKQRNDICPWEDENSCESDAPFVKTYATLGYL